MTGSELFTFLEFEEKLRGRIEKAKREMPWPGQNPTAGIKALEETAEELNQLLHLLNPTVRNAEEEVARPE